MSSDILKPFQRATVEAACETLLAREGPRRFLVADEVGLGKTLVAREVVARLVAERRRDRRPAHVLYVCSSQAIAAQNLAELAKAVPSGRCGRPRVERLTLWPSIHEEARRQAREEDHTLQLVAFTPGTSFDLRSSLGTWPERAFMFRVLAKLNRWKGSRWRSLARHFRGNVKPEHWSHYLRHDRQLLPARDQPFWPRIAEEVRHVFDSALEDALRSEERPARVIGRLRECFARVALDFVSPDLVIFDEFQRFRALLAPEPPANATRKEVVAQTLAQALLEASGPRRPRALLLSATPFRLFGYGWEREAPGDSHYDELFEVLRFLRGGGAQDEDLREAFRAYHDRLLRSAWRSDPELLAARDRVTELLRPLIARTERALHESGDLQVVDEAKKLAPGQGVAPLDERDLEAYRLVRQSVDDTQRLSEATQYWSSVPYALQMLQGYRLRDRIQLVERPAPALVLDDPAPADLEVPHAKFRQLVAEHPPDTLALPWIQPSLPWWQPEGVWRSAPSSKVLIFSRWRVVPRALSVLLSHLVGAACSRRGRALRRGDRLDFTLKKGRAGRGPLFRLFHPSPWLARAADPFAAAREARRGDEAPTLDDVRAGVERQIRRSLAELGVKVGRTDRYAPVRRWRLLPALDAQAGLFAPVLAAWRGAASGEERLGVQAHVEQLESAAEAEITKIGRGDLEWLVETALASPAVTLLRAIERRFPGRATDEQRLRGVIRVAYEGFGHLMGLEWQRSLLAKHYPRVKPHSARVLASARDGNLESVWDEYVWITSRLGGGEGAEERVLDRLATALDLRVVSAQVDRISGRSLDGSFAMRRHVAQAFLVEGSAKIDPDHARGDETSFRPDDLRTAFNAPFWPHVLVTTSVGQEGLDFHVYCDRVVHWNLPSNPVDLEQREGRIQRFGSLAIRRAVIRDQLGAAFATGVREPWEAAFANAEEDETGLQPWWVYPGAAIRRLILATDFSEELGRYERLRDELALYRLALGQPDQEDLLHGLRRLVDDGVALDDEERRKWIREHRIDLSAFSREVCVSPVT